MESSEKLDLPLDGSDSLLEIPEFREMKMRAEAAEAKLRRIYNTPFWKITKPARKLYSRVNQSLARRSTKKYEFQVDPNEGTLVTELVKGKTKLETNNANLDSNFVAIVAHFSKSTNLSESLTRYLRGLIDFGYEVVLVSACESSGELQIDKALGSRVSVIRKPNLGYDFGSWAVALDIFPELFDVENLILTNDSLIGPFEDFSETLVRLNESKFDVTGITDNSQLQYHIQSYLVHLNSRALKNTNIQKFLKSIVHLGLKNDVILKYELGLTRVAQLSGLFVGSIFPWNLVVQQDNNPSLAGWNRLFELGFPFLKREAVRLGSYFEVKNMTETISSRYPNSKWATDEIKEIS